MPDLNRILGAISSGVGGYAQDRERHKLDAAQQIAAQRQARQDAIANALSEAQTAKTTRETTLLGAVRPPAPPQVVSPGQGVRRADGGYDVPVPEAPKATPQQVHADNRTFDVENPLPVQAVPRPPNEAQTRAQLVFPRASAAAQQLEEFYTKGAALQSTASKVPVVGNYMLSEDQQRMNQAAETVAASILRLESGAAITESEVRSYAKQFLPTPGDSPEVREQKRATLKQQIEAMRSLAERGSLVASAPSTGPNAAPPKLTAAPSDDVSDEDFAAAWKAGKRTDADIRAWVQSRPKP